MSTTEEIKAARLQEAVDMQNQHIACGTRNAETQIGHILMLADAYLALVNRTSSEAAKAAAEEIRKEVNRMLTMSLLPQFIAEPATVSFVLKDSWDEKFAAIIQRHVPPVNERLAVATKRLAASAVSLIAMIHEESPYLLEDEIFAVGIENAIAEARAVIEGR